MPLTSSPIIPSPSKPSTAFRRAESRLHQDDKFAALPPCAHPPNPCDLGALIAGRLGKMTMSRTDIIGTVQPVEVDLEPEDRQRQAVIGQVAVGGGATYVIVGSELMTLQRSAERNAAETITLETCLQSLQTAVLYNVDDLKEASLAFIAENRKEVFALYAEQIAALPSDCRMAIQASAARRSLSVARRFS